MDKPQLITYKIFEPFKRIMAFTTTKHSFEHPAPRFTGDSPSVYMDNRRSLSEILRIDTDKLVFPRQTHSCSIVNVVEIPQNEFVETDALITSEKGICICIQTADCVPVILYDPQKHVAAAIHAGWRGTVGKIVQHTVNKLVAEFGTLPNDLIAAIGPSICNEIYEVGGEVADEVSKSLPFAEKVLQRGPKAKFHFNLWEANRMLLIDSGLQPGNIEILAECSYMEKNLYFSARRDGSETGRMVSGIMLS